MRIILITLLLATSFQSYSQKIATTYYDSLWFLTNRKYCEYFRIGVIDTNEYKYFGEVKDYYKSGNLEMKGTFVSNMKVDSFFFYYPSGKLKTKGFYQNNIRYGIWSNYYENGKLKDKIAFNNDFICALEYYDEDGNPKMINGTGVWETEYFNDIVYDIVTIKGSYKDTLRDGTWNYYRKSLVPGISHDTQLECTEVYENGNFIRGKYYWGGGGIQDIGSPTINILPETKKFEKTESWQQSKYASIEAYPYLKFLPKTDSTFYPVDKPASFVGGIDSLTKVFAKKIKLSKSYIASQKLRSATFGILIDENGKLIIKIDSNYSSIALFPDNQVFYEQALKTIKRLPNWIPAKRGNKNVKNYFMLSVLMDNGVISILLNNYNDK